MNIGFIGAGNMAEAYIKSLVKSNNEIEIFEINNERAEYISNSYKVKKCKSLRELIEISKIIVLAVKPNIINKVLDNISKIENINLEDKIFVSIAAGVKISAIENGLQNSQAKIVRVMPNTPSLIGKGMSGVSFNKNIVSDEKKNDIIEILKATGKVIEFDEKKLDIVTAISGSGPAFVYMMINSIADGGVRLGLSKNDSLNLAIETFIGAASMIKETEEHPDKLKDMVTSPGGTTAEGLYNLEKNGVRKALIETVENTYKKAKELGKEGD